MTLAVTVPGRFDELSRGPYLDQVIAANRVYVTAALTDPAAGVGRRWVLCCLPPIGGRSRLSAVSMGGQEVFTVLKPHRGRGVDAKVVVSLEVLDSFGAEFDSRGLERARSTYLAAGDDQVQVFGDAETLARALSAVPLRTAAQVAAERLLTGPAPDAACHDAAFADRVLGRA